MQQSKLRLLARGTAMAADLEAIEAGVKRFIGRRLDRSLGHELKDPKTGEISMSGGWPPNLGPDEKPFRAEYRAHVRDGDLWAADEETAALCGVKFDPTFGGEFAEEKA